MKQATSRMSARDVAYDYLRRRIIHFTLKPGDVISDHDVALELDMSRTPVREALILLEKINFIEVRPQSGTFVGKIDCKAVEEEQYIRYCVEREMMRQAAGRLKAKHIKLFEKNVKLFHEVNTKTDPDARKRLLDLDNDFHSIIFSVNGQEACHERLMRQLQHLERERMLSFLFIEDQVIEQEHRAMMQALIEGRAEEADQILGEHMQHFREDMLHMAERFPDYFA